MAQRSGSELTDLEKVILSYALSRSTFTLGELVRDLEHKKSTAHKYCSLLVEKGYLKKMSIGYRLGVDPLTALIAVKGWRQLATALCLIFSLMLLLAHPASVIHLAAAAFTAAALALVLSS